MATSPVPAKMQVKFTVESAGPEEHLLGNHDVDPPTPLPSTDSTRPNSITPPTPSTPPNVPKCPSELVRDNNKCGSRFQVDKVGGRPECVEVVPPEVTSCEFSRLSAHEAHSPSHTYATNTG